MSFWMGGFAFFQVVGELFLSTILLSHSRSGSVRLRSVCPESFRVVLHRVCVWEKEVLSFSFNPFLARQSINGRWTLSWRCSTIRTKKGQMKWRTKSFCRFALEDLELQKCGSFCVAKESISKHTTAEHYRFRLAALFLLLLRLIVQLFDRFSMIDRCGCSAVY